MATTPFVPCDGVQITYKESCVECGTKHPGRRLTVVNQIGRGSFSTCWLARRKVYACPEAGDANPAKRTRRSPSGGASRATELVVLKVATSQKKWKAERDIHSLVSHPSIVKFHQSIHVRGVSVFVLEWCANRTLADRVKQRVLFPEEIPGLARQLLEAVVHLHAHGIVHRDVKPNNILFQTPTTLKLCDFGLATHWKPGDGPMTQLTGTPNYLAPEMLRMGEYTDKVDEWAVGCTLYYMYAKRVLYSVGPSKKHARANLFRAIRSEPIPDLPAGCTGAAREALAGLLDKDPLARFSVAHVLSTLPLAGSEDPAELAADLAGPGEQGASAARPGE